MKQRDKIYNLYLSFESYLNCDQLSVDHTIIVESSEPLTRLLELGLKQTQITEVWPLRILMVFPALFKSKIPTVLSRLALAIN